MDFDRGTHPVAIPQPEEDNKGKNIPHHFPALQSLVAFIGKIQSDARGQRNLYVGPIAHSPGT